MRGGVLAKKTARVTLTTPRRIIRVAGRVYHLRGKGKYARKKVVVVVIRPRGSPKGNRPLSRPL
jgi:hypothetical protein